MHAGSPYKSARARAHIHKLHRQEHTQTYGALDVWYEMPSARPGSSFWGEFGEWGVLCPRTWLLCFFDQAGTLQGFLLKKSGALGGLGRDGRGVRHVVQVAAHIILESFFSAYMLD